MQNTIKVGLVGYGVAAKFMHAPFLATLPGYKVVAVLERHRQESKQLFPDASIVKDLDELLETDAELVIITTPNETHFPYAARCLRAGKHIVVEKPFTIHSHEALELINLAKAHNSILSVYQNRRYVSDFLTIRQLLQDKALGDVHDYEAHYDRYRPEAKPNAWREAPEPGSGIFYDLGAHLLDQALVLFGVPETVTASIKLQRPHARTDDYFDIRLDYGFLNVTLKGGMLVCQPGPRYLLHGTTGSFIKYGEDPQEAKLRAGELPLADDWGMEAHNIFGSLYQVVNGRVQQSVYPSLKGNYGFFYNNLYDAIVHGKPVSEKPEQAFNTIRLIELAFESNQEQKTVRCNELLPVYQEALR